MGIIISGASGNTGAPLLDFHESFNDVDPPPSGTNWGFNFRSNTGPLRVFPTLGFVIVWNIVRVSAGNILRVVEVVSSGASRACKTISGFNFPMGRIWGAADSPPLPRPLQRYTFLQPMRATVRGTARIEIGVSATNGGLSLLGTDPAACWVSDPAVNGGAWTPQFRLIAAGGITTGPNSSISPSATAFQTLGLRMTERADGVGNLVEWTLNGVTIHSAIVNINSATISTLFPYAGLGQTAGTTMQIGEARYTVEEIG